MKISNNVSKLNVNKIDKMLSKKILLANTANKVGDQLGIANPSNPIFFKNSNNLSTFTPDIRYRNNLGYAAFESISLRNMLLVFAENNEIKKALNAIANDMVVTELKSHKYSVFPTINKTLIPEDKQQVVEAMIKYIDEIFYPKLWRMLNLHGNGLKKLIKEFFTTGKLAYEIVYDNLKRPKEIVNLIPIDPAELSKVKENGQTYYIQQPINGGQKRVLHENQIILVEYNEYDYGYVSYVHSLQRPFNIMRSMMNSKINWFAVKSQVRMHINLAMGDVSRNQAEQLLIEKEQEYTNTFVFNDVDGTIMFNGEPSVNSYQEFFTVETSNSGKPEIEEINSTGPDLTETDSLQFFEKYFWKQTEIPYDRIDPNSQDGWGFIDVSSLKKTELLFSKFQLDNKMLLNELWLKPLIIQLTLKEVEIGIDLSLLDAISIEWLSFNEYEKLAELEILDKTVNLVQALSDFGKIETPAGGTLEFIPKKWIIDNYFDYTNEQKESMESSFQDQLKMVYAFDKEVEKLEAEPEEPEEEIIDEESIEDDTDDGSDLGDILNTEDNEY